MRKSRQNLMEQYIAENDSVTMDELCKKFDISINTARADVAYLVEKGVAKKIYGGVCYNQTSKLATFDKRVQSMMNVKKKISKYAASLVEDGDIIFIDSGTTTMYIVDYLSELSDVTIVTNNLHVIIKAISNPNLTVISLPGVLDRKTNSYVDTTTYMGLERYNFQKSFMAATSITVDGKATNMSSMECEVKKTAMKQSRKSFLLADSTKFGKATLMTYGSLDEMEIVISDEQLEDKYIIMCEKMNTELKMVEN